MRLILVRHAQSTDNVLRRINEPHAPLSDEGFCQAKKVARRLRGESIDYIYTSPMLRARQTAQYIWSLHPEATFVLSYAIREREYGIFKGQPLDNVFEWVKNLPYDEVRNLHVKVPGGESIVDLRNRMASFLLELKNKHPNDCVLVVSHNLCLRCIHSVLINSFEKFALHKNTAVTIVELSSKTVFETLGCAKHLE